MRVKKSLPTDRKYTSAVVPDLKIKIKKSCLIRTEAYILMCFCVSYKKPESLCKKLRINIIQSGVWSGLWSRLQSQS